MSNRNQWALLGLIFATILCLTATLFTAVLLGDDPPAAAAWEDPTPDDNPDWTNEDTATNWTGNLQGELTDWDSEYLDLDWTIFTLADLLDDLETQTDNPEALALIDEAWDDLAKAAFNADLASYFVEQARPLVNSAAAYVEAEAWDTAINYCSQAEPEFFAAGVSSSAAWDYIANAQAHLYEAEMAAEPWEEE